MQRLLAGIRLPHLSSTQRPLFFEGHITQLGVESSISVPPYPPYRQSQVQLKIPPNSCGHLTCARHYSTLQSPVFDQSLVHSEQVGRRSFIIQSGKSSPVSPRVPKQFILRKFAHAGSVSANKDQQLEEMAPSLAPTVKLNNGCEMPMLGLGTYELKKSTCEKTVSCALDIGYRHIDTAYLYRNEKFIGKVLKEKIQAGKVEREEVFLVTKLWNTYHDPKKVMYICEKQLESLGVDYIDLYLMHSPVGYHYENDDCLMPFENGVLHTTDIDYLDTYKAMEVLVEVGLVRSLGLSNFNSEQIQRILGCCHIKPVTNQVECHPRLNQKKMIAYCRDNDILVTAYSPLARPKASKELPTFYKCGEIEAIAEKYNKTVQQVVLRYLVDIGTIPIPKTKTPERLKQNIDIFNFQLTPEEILTIDGFDTGQRIWKFDIAKNHKYWPYNIEF